MREVRRRNGGRLVSYLVHSGRQSVVMIGTVLLHHSTIQRWCGMGVTGEYQPCTSMPHDNSDLYVLPIFARITIINWMLYILLTPSNVTNLGEEQCIQDNAFEDIICIISALILKSICYLFPLQSLGCNQSRIWCTRNKSFCMKSPWYSLWSSVMMFVGLVYHFARFLCTLVWLKINSPF